MAVSERMRMESVSIGRSYIKRQIGCEPIQYLRSKQKEHWRGSRIVNFNKNYGMSEDL